MNKKCKTDVEYSVIVALLIVIIVGNFIIEPPMLFHNYGHFGILIHPIDSIKELFFAWGYNQHSFIFSLKGLQMYFNMIPVMYQKYGFIKTTFAYFTQFSPVWAFIPLKLVYDSCVEFLNSNDTQDVTDGIDVQGVENE